MEPINKVLDQLINLDLNRLTWSIKVQAKINRLVGEAY